MYRVGVKMRLIKDALKATGRALSVRPGPAEARRRIESIKGVQGNRGPRASGNRIRIYAGPVSWVSNCVVCS